MAPWCGSISGGACSGLPLQVQSDYTFTALGGVFGTLLASATVLATLVWLYALIRHHPKVTSGSPRVTNGVLDARQAVVSWMTATWSALTMCQLAVTVAGNVGILPLTGVTFPFMSYGATSMWVNCLFLGMALNLDLPGSDHFRET